MPTGTLVVAGMIAGLTVILAVWVTGKGPWLGLSVAPDSVGAGAGVRIETIAADAPSALVLKPGDRIVALAAPTGDWLRLQAVDVMREPDNLAAFAKYNHFLNRQHTLATILDSPVVRIRLDSGVTVRVRPEPRRPWTSLSVDYWLLIGLGVLALMIAVGVWASARSSRVRLPIDLLGLSGIGFMLTAVSSAVYIERELALDALLFHRLELINQGGILLFAFAGSAILSCYPRRLTRFPLHWAILGSGALVWINLFFQSRDLPIHNVYMSLFAGYLFAAGMALFQWHKTRGDPLARATLKWLFLSIFLSTGVALLLFFVPVVFNSRPLSSAVATGAIGFLMFVGLATGVARYRLFDLERWWADIWLWFGAGTAVVMLDALFVVAMGVIPLRAFGLAIIVVGWLYIPIRTRLWRTVRVDSGQWWQQYLPETLESVFSAPSRAIFLQRWALFLHHTFRPLDVRASNETVANARVIDNGIRLRIPPLGAGSGVDLLYKQRGSRLFTREDSQLADTFVALATRSLHAFEARERGVARERERIMRDLHDDVGANLLTLSRRCDEPRNARLAKGALDTLRDVVHSLTFDAARTLPEAVADLRGNAVDRCEEADIVFNWTVAAALPEIPLTGLQYVNLRRCLQEAVSNLLKHARATHADFNIAVENGRLVITIINDGVTQSARGTGRGLGNIAVRAAELGGSARHQTSDSCFTLHIEVPLSEGADDNATSAIG